MGNLQSSTRAVTSPTHAKVFGVHKVDKWTQLPEIDVDVTDDEDSEEEVFQEIENVQSPLVTDKAENGEEPEEVNLVLNEYLQFDDVDDAENFEMLGDSTHATENCALQEIDGKHAEEADEGFVIVNKNDAIEQEESMDFESARNSELFDFVTLNGKFNFRELLDFEALRELSKSNEVIQEIVESENVEGSNPDLASVNEKNADEVTKPNELFTCGRCGCLVETSHEFQCQGTVFEPDIVRPNEDDQPGHVVENIQVKSKPAERELFRCVRCAQSMETFEEIKSHMLTHKGKRCGKNQSGDEGDRAENVMKNFGAAPIRHMKSELNRPAYTCLHCEQKMDTYKQFRSHMFMHESKIYECKICKKSYRRQCHLSRHMNQMH